MATAPLRVALVGAGSISAQYLGNLVAAAEVEVVAVTDLVPAAAAARAAEFAVPEHGVPETLWDRDDVDLVVNLTIPSAHAEVSETALRAGKHVWSEKPLAMDVASGRRVVALAEELGLRLGCAPDTFLGPGLQTAFAAVRDGLVGEPRSARALMRYRGPESWHPNPAFLYAPGAGPLFDMGPYYLTALVHAMGSIASVVAVGDRPMARRTIATGPLAGTDFAVGTDSTVAALLRFASGASASLLLSFDAPVSLPIEFEITGSSGVLRLPDPNDFDGAVTVRDAEGSRAIEVPAASTSRGTGVVDLARAIAEGRPHAASGAVALHVLDAMASIAAAIEDRAEVALTTTV